MCKDLCYFKEEVINIFWVHLRISYLTDPLSQKPQDLSFVVLILNDEEIEVQTVGRNSGTLRAGQFINWDLSIALHGAEACRLPC